MPIHDWTKVDAGLFHAFHFYWIGAIADTLNGGRLPPDYYALPEQNAGGSIPDVLTLKRNAHEEQSTGGIAVTLSPPKVKVIQQVNVNAYSDRANRITIRHRHGDVVAVIEIISPGNKASRLKFDAFLEKSISLIGKGVSLLVVDLFPPTPRDPEGIHAAIWAELGEVSEESFLDKPLTLASYDAGPDLTAYLEPIAVGDPLPDMPLFLSAEHYINVPFQTTYDAAWNKFPAALKPLLTS